MDGGAWQATVHGVAKIRTWLSNFTFTFSLSRYTNLREGSGTLLGSLAWKIPWTEEPGRLQSMGSLRIAHDWETLLWLLLSCVGEGNGNPLQCSCQENPRDGGAWWAAVSGVSQSRTRLKRLSSSSSSGAWRAGWPAHPLAFLWECLWFYSTQETSSENRQSLGTWLPRSLAVTARQGAFGPLARCKWTWWMLVSRRHLNGYISLGSYVFLRLL